MKKLYGLSMYILFITVFTNEFINLNPTIYTILSCIGIFLLLASSLTLTRGFQLYVSILSLVIGHIILFQYNVSFDVWYNSFIKSIGIPVLFVAIPMISFPIKHGQYLSSIESYAHSKANNPTSLFSLLTMMHIALTIPLNIGSIPTMQKLLEKMNLPKKYLAYLYSAGYCSYMVISPYDGVINMILLYTAISYSNYFVNGMSMVILILIVFNLILITDKELLKALKKTLSSIKAEEMNKGMYELLLHIAILILLAFLGDKFISFSNQVYVIALIIIIYSIIWGSLLKVLPKYKKEFKGYTSHLLKFKSFLPFLISTSFLGSMISLTPLKDSIGKVLVYLNHFPLYIVLFLFILITMILSLCGVHMMITVTTLALTISPKLIGLSNGAFALTLLTCWYAAMSISPFAPFSAIIADTIGKKPLTITKYNLKFSILMLLLAPLVIIVLNNFN